MNEAEKAAFQFERFKIPAFSYHESNNKAKELNLKFDVSGIYSVAKGVFELTLTVHGFEGNPDAEPDGLTVMKVTSLAYFKFADNLPFDKIPDYFYRNSIAIVFPFIRAFLSTMTLQAQVKMINLSIMNLTGLEQSFREKITIV